MSNGHIITRSKSKMMKKPIESVQVAHSPPQYIFNHHTHHEEQSDPIVPMIQAAFGILVMIVFGYLTELLTKIGFINHKSIHQERDRDGYAPLFAESERFFRHRMFKRVADQFGTPILSMASPITLVSKRDYKPITDKYIPNGQSDELINLSSYNYLEMNSFTGPTADAVQLEIETNGVGVCSTPHELGTHAALKELEQVVTSFLGVEDSIIVGMGFATNALNIPCLVGTETLVVSDQNNHSSIALGCKLCGSGTVIRPFRHNDMSDLESNLRRGILEGNPKTKRPFKKIIIMVEGVYSMEGSIVHLKEVIALKNKYKAYLFMDEAHSIGSTGPTGRGICELEEVDPTEVDVLMGTFTKSFGAAGGYLAGKKEIIRFIRSQCGSHCYGTSMAPPIVRQVICTLNLLQDKVFGVKKVKQLAENTTYFRHRLQQEGFHVMGHEASPVVPILTFSFANTIFMTREMKKYGLLVVAVGPPATPYLKARLRFCLSSGHTISQLERVIQVLKFYADSGALYVKSVPSKEKESIKQ